MAGLFYKLGRLAGPKLRKGQWLWQSMAGSEDDILAAERSVGRDMHAAMCEQIGIDADAETRSAVKEIGDGLAACVADKHRSFCFTVAAQGEPNAFALPGGFVFITRSLIELMRAGGGVWREELAFVLGHEMAHVIKQHPMGRIFNDAALSAAARAIPVAGGAAGRWAKSSALRLMQSAYSQDNELVADKLGARLAQAGGFGTEGGPRLLGRLRDLSGGPSPLPLAEYFATHPPMGLRIAELRRFFAREVSE